MDSQNGQTESERERSKPKRHTGERCGFADRQQVVNALAKGDSIRSVARALHKSVNTVIAIGRTETEAIGNCQRRKADEAAELADRARKRALATIDSASPAVANAIYGTAIDKMIALGGDAPSSIPTRLPYHPQTTPEGVRDLIVFRTKYPQYEVGISEFLYARQIALDLGWMRPTPAKKPALPNGECSESGASGDVENSESISDSGADSTGAVDASGNA